MGHVGRVGRRGTQRWNARRGEETEEKDRKEKQKEHSLERAICAESRDIRPNIAQKGRAKEEEAE